MQWKTNDEVFTIKLQSRIYASCYVMILD